MICECPVTPRSRVQVCYGCWMPIDSEEEIDFEGEEEEEEEGGSLAAPTAGLSSTCARIGSSTSRSAPLAPKRLAKPLVIISRSCRTVQAPADTKCIMFIQYMQWN